MRKTRASARLRSTLWLYALLILCGCNKQQETVELTGEEPFREGDLVLRCGYGMESRAVTAASKSAYSHIGILHFDEQTSTWTVVHAVPGEAGEDGRETLKSEPLTDFFAPDRAIRGAWMRVDCTDTVAQAATAYALSKVEQEVLFDNDYQLTDTTTLYCTELVWQAYQHQGLDLSDGQRHSVPTLISKDGECIFPSDIKESSHILFYKPFKTTKL